jgi:hypothetical protein
MPIPTDTANIIQASKYFPKTVEGPPNTKMPEGWYEASVMLSNHKHYVPLYKI